MEGNEEKKGGKDIVERTMMKADDSTLAYGSVENVTAGKELTVKSLEKVPSATKEFNTSIKYNKRKVSFSNFLKI